MIPYDDLERALARWKARAHTSADAAPAVELGDESKPRLGSNGRSELSGEIDINELNELTETE